MSSTNNKLPTNKPYQVDNYLARLPEYTTNIDLSGRDLSTLPSLTRFTHLKTLNLCNNPLVELPPFPQRIQTIYLSHVSFESLPLLPPSVTTLRILSCPTLKRITPPLPASLVSLHIEDAALETLPHLPPFLQYLNVRGTRLARLPPLPSTLKRIVADHCSLQSVPRLPSSVIRVDFSNNPLWHMVNAPGNLTYPFGLRKWMIKETPLFDILYNPFQDSTCFELDELGEKGDLYKFLQRLKILNRFRDLFYALKLKRRFRHWLWVRVRLPRIERANHPALLQGVLEAAGEDAVEGVMFGFGGLSNI
jgi:hypothetical protein